MNTQQTEVKLRTTINAPVESVWATIRTFDEIEKYLGQDNGMSNRSLLL